MGRKDRRSWLFAAGMGCLALGILAVVVIMVVGVWAGIAYSRIGPPDRTATGLTVPLQDRSAPIRLTIDMGTGEFEIRPGPAGSDITVTGRHTANYYELIHDPGSPSKAGRSIDIKLAPTHAFFLGILAQIASDGPPNHLVITIPPDVPIGLSVSFRNGRSVSEVGGLHLTDLTAHFEDGDHRLGLASPLAAPLDGVAIIGERSTLDVHGLGNARFRSLDVRTNLGFHTVDLSGAWAPRREAEASFRHSMGSLELWIHEGIQVVSTSPLVPGHGESGDPRRHETDPVDPDAPRLTVNLHSSVGSTVRAGRR